MPQRHMIDDCEYLEDLFFAVFKGRPLKVAVGGSYEETVSKEI